MTDLQSTLLSLLRIAVGESTANLSPIGCSDWKQLLKLAHSQGVLGIVWYAMEQLQREDKLIISRQEKLMWFGTAQQLTAKMKTRHDHIHAFAQNVRPYKPVALKGIDYARYWPVTLAREYGDFDCYFGSDAQAVNELAKRNGCQLEELDDYKHNRILFNKLIIENHHIFVSYGGSKNRTIIERRLRDVYNNTPLTSFGPNLWSPSSTFTAIFMVMHMCHHFFHEGIRMRFILDWIYFTKAESHTIDWDCVNETFDECHLTPFVQVLEAYAKGIKDGRLNESNKLVLDFHHDLFATKYDDSDRRPIMMIRRMYNRVLRLYRFRTINTDPLIPILWRIVSWSSFVNRHPKELV